jgi:hypothetical protein
MGELVLLALACVNIIHNIVLYNIVL